MTFPIARVVVSALLFVGWLGFLLFLVIDSRGVILSRPQFLEAQLFVVADIGGGQADKPGAITIEELLWSEDAAADERLVNTQIRIPGLADATNQQGYEGPGKYLLPLRKTTTGSFLIAALPRMAPTPEIRIYPWTPDLRRQVDEIVKSRQRL